MIKLTGKEKNGVGEITELISETKQKNMENNSTEANEKTLFSIFTAAAITLIVLSFCFLAIQWDIQSALTLLLVDIPFIALMCNSGRKLSVE